MIASACLTTLASCSLFVDLSDLSKPNDAGSGVSDSAAGDAIVSKDGSLEQNDGAAISLTPHLLAAVGNVPAETGMAQQQHLIYAANGSRWWFFFITDSQPGNMNASWSDDFTSWNAANTRGLSETMGGEGRNFSVAYASLGGVDIVHTINSHFFGTTEDARHARNTIHGTNITYETGITVASAAPFDTLANPDGCVTALGSDGFVYDASGYFNQKPTTGVDTLGHQDIFRSTIADVGAPTWTASLPHDFSAAASGYVHNRALIPLANGTMLALWPTTETPTDTGNIASSTTASPLTNVFSGGTGTAMNAMNDWSACAVTPSDVHVVRRLLDGGKNDTFEHMRRNGTDGTWSAAGTIAPDPGKYGSGVVLVSQGTELLLVTIANDANDSVRGSKWNGTSWSAWTTIVGTPATRSYLSGSGCGTGAAKSGVVWTEGDGASYKVVGVDVSSLF
ncbi:MAG: hypothetical protein ABI461_17425 [Polyangiaceae bacterium]